MKTLSIKLVILTIFAVSLIQCKSQSETTTKQDKVIQAKPQKSDNKSKEKHQKKKILPRWSRKKKEILVGGCDELCGDPKNAFRNFIRSLFGVIDKSKVLSFVDTTRLVYNKKELGRRWADMWLFGQKDARKREIEEWLESFLARIGQPVDISQVEDSLEDGVRFRRLSSEEVEFIYQHPQLKEYKFSPVWKIRMGLRGLEWLVIEFQDEGEIDE